MLKTYNFLSQEDFKFLKVLQVKTLPFFSLFFCQKVPAKAPHNFSSSSQFFSKNNTTIDFVNIVLLNEPLTNNFVKLTMLLKNHQGLVVQSIISLTSSLRGQLIKRFTTL